MTTVPQPRILVGVSGSRASENALRWAAQHAGCRSGQLEVVLCWQPQQLAYYAARTHADHAQELRAADRRLTGVLRAAFGQVRPAGLITDVIEGPAERTLVDRSVGADLLVLGSSSAPTLASQSVGAVVRGCLRGGHCPVVVVGPLGLSGDHDAAYAGHDDGVDRVKPAAHLDGRAAAIPRSGHPHGHARPPGYQSVSAGAMATSVPAPRSGD
jgi:nucleotide-binding universal stress UspA family protein